MIITYLKLFCTFAKIGMFTIGGGYAMIPLIGRAIGDYSPFIRHYDVDCHVLCPFSGQ